MARTRNPDRDRAFEIWRDSGGAAKLKEIAAELNIPDSRIRKWKTEDRWDDKIKERSDSPKGALLYSNRSAPKKIGPPLGNINAKGHGPPKGNRNAAGHGAPKGNKNALGNQGGAPEGNKNAVTTGEYETIWFDCLTEEEQLLYDQIDTDTLSQVEIEIKFFTVRERRMMERIKMLISGLTEKERRVLQELQTHKTPIPLYDEKSGTSKTILVPESKLVITEITETEYRAIDDILKLEESLTRVQDKKAKWLALKHSIEMMGTIEAEKVKLSKARLLFEIEKAKGDNKENHHADVLRRKMAERKIKNGST